MEFFTKLGFTFNTKFTNENATCMIVSEDAFVMLLVEPLFRDFTKNQICDTARTPRVCSRSRSRAAPRSTRW